MNTETFDVELERLKQATMESGERPDYIDADLVMRGLYESSFGIRNHYGPDQHPFASVAANPKEDYGPYSSLYRDAVTFIEERVGEAFNCSFDEFFRKPRGEIDILLAAVKQRNRKNSTAMNAATAAASNLVPGNHPKPPFK